MDISKVFQKDEQIFGNMKYYCIFVATFCGGISTRCLNLEDY